MNKFLAGFTLLLLVGLVAAPARAEKPDVKGDGAEIVKGNNAFALDLYAQLRAQDGNLFLSPASLSTALAMTSAGASGETLAEMTKALHFTLPQEKLHPAFASLLHHLDTEAVKRPYQLSVANRLWGQKGYTFLAEFLTATKDHYGAGLEEVDFKSATEDARKTINAWVEKRTQEKIKDLLAEGILNNETRLVLTNAVYFKGDWDSPFKKDETKDGPFYVGPDRTVTVPLMRQKNRFGYLDGKTFQLVRMPYAGRELSMVVLLPKKRDGLPELEKELTASHMDRWLNSAEMARVDVTLPRFQLTGAFSLKERLEALGVRQAFTRAADFSRLNGQKDLYLSAVVHKAFVDVNEQGTEAAGATAVVVETKGLVITPVFRADHPFVFLIRDDRSGSILFLGRVANPK